MSDMSGWVIAPTIGDGEPVKFDFSVRPIPSALKFPELCHVPMDFKANEASYQMGGELKVDGMRLLYFGAPLNMLVTKEGQPVEAAAHVLYGLQQLERAYGMPMFFDMEFEAGTFEETNAVFRRRKPGQGRVWIFDAMPVEMWASLGHMRQSDWIDRKDKLYDMAAKVPRPHVGVLLHASIAGAMDAHALAQKAWDRKLEGIVTKDKRSSYWRCKSATWLKLKITQTMDCVIIGRDKNGSILLRDPDGVEFKPGGVLARAMRQQLADLEAGEELVGTVVEVEHNARTSANNQPRHPRITRIRSDLRNRA